LHISLFISRLKDHSACHPFYSWELIKLTMCQTQTPPSQSKYAMRLYRVNRGRFIMAYLVYFLFQINFNLSLIQLNWSHGRSTALILVCIHNHYLVLSASYELFHLWLGDIENSFFKLIREKRYHHIFGLGPFIKVFCFFKRNIFQITLWCDILKIQLVFFHILPGQSTWTSMQNKCTLNFFVTSSHSIHRG